jgi:hypothetical protein
LFDRRDLLTTCYSQSVPIISVFFGVIVRTHYKEHEPEHFHAERVTRMARTVLGAGHQGQQGKFDFSGS